MRLVGAASAALAVCVVVLLASRPDCQVTSTDHWRQPTYLQPTGRPTEQPIKQPRQQQTEQPAISLENLEHVSVDLLDHSCTGTAARAARAERFARPEHGHLLLALHTHARALNADLSAVGRWRPACAGASGARLGLVVDVDDLPADRSAAAVEAAAWRALGAGGACMGEVAVVDAQLGVHNKVRATWRKFMAQLARPGIFGRYECVLVIEGDVVTLSDGWASALAARCLADAEPF